MRLKFIEPEPRFHGPFKPEECWHWQESGASVRCSLTIEEGRPTVIHVECGLPVDLAEPEEYEMHDPVMVDAEYYFEQDYFGEINACYLLLTPVRS